MNDKLACSPWPWGASLDQGRKRLEERPRPGATKSTRSIHRADQPFIPQHLDGSRGPSPPETPNAVATSRELGTQVAFPAHDPRFDGPPAISRYFGNASEDIDPPRPVAIPGIFKHRHSKPGEPISSLTATPTEGNCIIQILRLSGRRRPARSDIDDILLAKKRPRMGEQYSLAYGKRKRHKPGHGRVAYIQFGPLSGLVRGRWGAGALNDLGGPALRSIRERG